MDDGCLVYCDSFPSELLYDAHFPKEFRISAHSAQSAHNCTLLHLAAPLLRPVPLPSLGEEPEDLAPEEEEAEGAAEETPEGMFSTSMSMSPTPDSEGTVAIEGAGTSAVATFTVEGPAVEAPTAQVPAPIASEETAPTTPEETAPPAEATPTIP